MALKDTWIDRKDGDEIRPEDINDVANAVIENEKAIEDKASKDHTHDLAGTSIKDISLLDLPNEISGEDTGVTEKSVFALQNGYFKFYIKGHVRFSRSSIHHLNFDHYNNIYVDGKKVELVEQISNPPTYSIAFEGEVAEGIEIRDLNMGTVTFDVFEKIIEKDGFMSAEQAKKLANAPTTKDVHNIVNEAFGIVVEAFDEVHEYAESLGGDEA